MKEDIFVIISVLAIAGTMIYAYAVDEKIEYVEPVLAEYCKPLIECEDK